MKIIKVLLDDRKNGGRKTVDAELIEDRSTTVKVKLLSDGSIITRKKSRDLPKENKHEAL